jgi:hypothetical protein
MHRLAHPWALLLALCLGCNGAGKPPETPSEGEGEPDPAPDGEPTPKPAPAEGEGGLGDDLMHGDSDDDVDAKDLARVDMKFAPAKIKAGKLTAAAVAKALEAQADAVRGCYAKEIHADASAHGKLTIDFTVTLYGNLTDVDASSDFSSDRMVQCVVDAFYALAFDRPDVEAKVSQLITFGVKPEE